MEHDYVGAEHVVLAPCEGARRGGSGRRGDSCPTVMNGAVPLPLWLVGCFVFLVACSSSSSGQIGPATVDFDARSYWVHCSAVSESLLGEEIDVTTEEEIRFSEDPKFGVEGRTIAGLPPRDAIAVMFKTRACEREPDWTVAILASIARDDPNRVQAILDRIEASPP